MLAVLCNLPCADLRRQLPLEAGAEPAIVTTKLVSVFHIDLKSFPIYFDAVSSFWSLVRALLPSLCIYNANLIF